MSTRVLLSWIGPADMGMFLRGDAPGPLEHFCLQHPADQLLLLSPHDKERGASFKNALSRRLGISITAVHAPVRDLEDVQGVYNSVLAVLRYARENYPQDQGFDCFLSSGGLVPAALWLLAPHEGVKAAPWFLDPGGRPQPLQWLCEPDDRLLHLGDQPAAPPEFSLSRAAERGSALLERFGFLVLTGPPGFDPQAYLSQIFPRRQPHILSAARVAAEPSILDGALSDRSRKSPLFLAHPEGLEPKQQNALLLRILEGESGDTPAGTEATPVTRPLILAVSQGWERRSQQGLLLPELADAFHRASLSLPALPPREEDLRKMIHRYMRDLNSRYALREEFRDKILAQDSWHYLTSPPRPFSAGRELQGALEKAFLLTRRREIRRAELEEVFWENPVPQEKEPSIHGTPRAFESGQPRNPLDYPLEEGVDLRERLREVARHYLSRAMRLTGGNKTRSAELLGLNHYQTLTNWLRRYGLDDTDFHH